MVSRIGTTVRIRNTTVPRSGTKVAAAKKMVPAVPTMVFKVFPIGFLISTRSLSEAGFRRSSRQSTTEVSVMAGTDGSR